MFSKKHLLALAIFGASISLNAVKDAATASERVSALCSSYNNIPLKIKEGQVHELIEMKNDSLKILHNNRPKGVEFSSKIADPANPTITELCDRTREFAGFDKSEKSMSNVLKKLESRVLEFEKKYCN